MTVVRLNVVRVSKETEIMKMVTCFQGVQAESEPLVCPTHSHDSLTIFHGLDSLLTRPGVTIAGVTMFQCKSFCGGHHCFENNRYQAPLSLL